MYEYRIENISPKPPQVDEEKEIRLFHEFYKRQEQTRREKLLVKGFSGIPEPFRKRFHILGEIVSGRQFFGAAHYVQYTLSLPSEWRVDPSCPNTLTTAYTQISADMTIPNTNLRECRFSHPIEIALVTNGNTFNVADTFEMPKIFFKVMSVDVWDRHAVVGYGFITLSLSPGSFDVELETWKPFLSYESFNKSYFVGGSPELEDVQDILLYQVDHLM